MLQRGLSRRRRRACGKEPAPGPRLPLVPSASDAGWARTEQSHWRGGRRSPPPGPGPALGHLCPLPLVPRPSLWDGDLDDTASLWSGSRHPQDSLDGAPHALSPPAAQSPARLGPAQGQTNVERPPGPSAAARNTTSAFLMEGRPPRTSPGSGSDSDLTTKTASQSPLSPRGPWPHSLEQRQGFAAYVATGGGGGAHSPRRGSRAPPEPGGRKARAPVLGHGVWGERG